MGSRSELLRILAVATAVTVALVSVVWLTARDGGGGDAPVSAETGPTTPDDTEESSDAPTVAARGGVRGIDPDQLEDLEDLAGKAESRAGKRRGTTRGKVKKWQGKAQEFAFTIASFNVLGSNHTGRGGDASGYASGTARMATASTIIERNGLDIIGFSEIQPDQLGVFRSRHGGYDVYPGTSLGNAGVPTNLAWRSDRFTLVSGSHLTIPFVGQRRHMPVVRLKERASGREFFVINAHNAPNSRQGERNAAVATEIAAIKRLRRTGLPVFLVGDLNEKTTVLCKVTSQTDLVAASPGGNLDGCGGFRGMRLDWIFGSEVTFSRYRQDTAPPVGRVTDHAVVLARATVG